MIVGFLYLLKCLLYAAIKIHRAVHINKMQWDPIIIIVLKKKKFDTPFPHIELKRRHINDTKYVYECNKGIWQS